MMNYSHSIMQLGFDGAHWSDLADGQLRRLRERINAYVLFPDDDQKRAEMQATFSAERLLEMAAINAVGRTDHKLSAVAEEEWSFFLGNGGFESLVNARGVPGYHELWEAEPHIRTNVANGVSQLLAMAMTDHPILREKGGPSRGKMYYLQAKATDHERDKKRKASSNAANPPGPQPHTIDDELKALFHARRSYLKQAWSDKARVSHLIFAELSQLIDYAATLGPNDKVTRDFQIEQIGDYIARALGVAAFLHASIPIGRSAPILKGVTAWMFAPSLVEGVAPKEMDDHAPLDDVEIKWLQQYIPDSEK